MTTTYYNWEELRASWVNGVRSDCLDALQQMTKTRLFKILSQALSNHWEFADNPASTRSGDLTDLTEMIRLLAKR